MAPWHLLVVALAGWINREQQAVIEYLTEENRILREHLSPGRPPFTNAQRRRLAARAAALGRRLLRDLECIVTPDTLLRWYRELVAKKCDGSAKRRPSRPRTREEIRELVVKLARENPTWGYTRIRDTMNDLGHVIVTDHGANNSQEPRSRARL